MMNHEFRDILQQKRQKQWSILYIPRFFFVFVPCCRAWTSDTWGICSNSWKWPKSRKQVGISDDLRIRKDCKMLVVARSLLEAQNIWKVVMLYKLTTAQKKMDGNRKEICILWNREGGGLELQLGHGHFTWQPAARRFHFFHDLSSERIFQEMDVSNGLVSGCNH